MCEIISPGDVLVILDSISVGLRRLTGNPRAKKNRSRGLFSVHEGRAIDFSTRPANLANPDDEFQIVFRQLSSSLALLVLDPSPGRRTRQPRARSSTPSKCFVMRAHVKTQWSRLTSSTFPLLRFFTAVTRSLYLKIYSTNFIVVALTL